MKTFKNDMSIDKPTIYNDIIFELPSCVMSINDLKDDINVRNYIIDLSNAEVLTSQYITNNQL